jgi:tetratricopeptide (TPR) repeat protein
MQLLKRILTTVFMILFFVGCGINSVTKDNIKKDTSRETPNSQLNGYLKAVEQGSNIALLHKIKIKLKENFNLSEYELIPIWQDTLDFSRIYEVGFNDLKKEGEEKYIVFFNNKLILFDVYNNKETVDLNSIIDQDIAMNLDKFEISISGSRIYIWSQQDSSAFEMNSVVEWNGEGLYILSQSLNDKTQEFFGLLSDYIEAGDIMAAIEYEVKSFPVEFPSAYKEYFELPKKIIKLAHNVALQEMEKDKYQEALRILQYGVEKYTLVHINNDFLGASRENLINIENEVQRGNILPLRELLEVYYDYALLLLENKYFNESKAYLEKIIELEPQKAEVYISLGDLYYEVGNLDEAVINYEKYIQIFGSSEAPQRVKERIQ